MPSWINAFMKLSERQEAPPEFKFFTGVSMIGAVLKRNVVLRYFEDVFPNTFILLVGDSGKTKKSTTTDIAYELLMDKRFKAINTIFGRITYEELLVGLVRPDMKAAERGEIRKDGSCYIISSEFTTLMEGQDRILGLLGDLYKSPRQIEYKTKNQGKFLIENVCVSLLAASTPKWLKRCIPDSETGEGFVGRTLWVAQQTHQDRIAWPDVHYRTRDAISHLQDKLHDISRLEGDFIIKDNARRLFIDWYESLGVPEDDRLQAINERKHVNILKLAMILAIDSTMELIIKLEHITEAIKMVEQLNPGIAMALEHVGTPATSRDARQVYGIINRKGGKILHSELARGVSYKMDAEHLGKVLDQLIEQDYIEKHVDEFKSGKRPVITYSIVMGTSYDS